MGPGHEDGDLMPTNGAGRSSQLGEGRCELYLFLGSGGFFRAFLMQTAENGLAWLILFVIHVEFTPCAILFFAFAFRDISLKENRSMSSVFEKGGSRERR